MVLLDPEVVGPWANVEGMINANLEKWSKS